MKTWLGAALVALLIGVAPGWSAEPGTPGHGAGRGPVTDLPMPRFVSLKASEANARRGPSTAHRIDWVYRLRDMPLRVTGEFEHWRRVEDAEGKGGWMHFALLSGVRTAMVTEDMVTLRRHPQPDAAAVAKLERGVVGRLVSCAQDWCQLQLGRTRGWVEARKLWGVEPGERFE